MLRVALVADTHLPRFGRALPAALVGGMEAAPVDRILHAGDWTHPLAVDLLEALAPVEGVAGNNDGPALHERFGTRRIVELGGVRIGLTHGHLGPGATSPARATRAFGPEDAVDAVVFGHSHIPLVRREPAPGDEPGRVRWLVNPGSPTDRRRQSAYSWALMTIDGAAITAVELVTFTDRGPPASRPRMASLGAPGGPSRPPATRWPKPDHAGEGRRPDARPYSPEYAWSPLNHRLPE